MKLFFQKEVLIDRIKKLMQLLIRIKDFVLEPPPGYLEYQKAITSKDANFNYMENEFFKRHILPNVIKGHGILNQGEHLSINHQQLINNNPHNIFRVNPVTGLPMIGSYDAGGSPFGFNFNHSINHHINHHSSFSNMHPNNQLNSFDYWNR
ncbi:hypothetical protein [Legionella bozemanae]|uniref:Uncharacterized protein n=1 Tax=Legionella bozemanae TaxID=447 RepID=A0A0W0REQ3_LEGBO|nr:hypothetical protein [Legionella bozemanae]KTC69539.1 hypothetical protein Lboz_3055 [Legionella bozemanae]STP10064.1 Uncharacterised protein [Legionella bozemanae]